MKRNFVYRRSSAVVVLMAIWLSPLVSFGQQTQVITPPKNKYKVQEDVKLGNDAARQVEQQFPLINDRDAAAYLNRVGERLVAAIPRELNQPAFNYRFRWVNASDINAFALPGGPMYVNRGMLEAAKNEGEMAGVMAHEISHVALRHATAQATKQSSAKNTLGTLGMVLGGAILGGQAGAELGALGAQAWATKYSRAYESQADALGARIMADAGYDPHDLANMFQTIQRQSGGGGGPSWLSSHPDPGNRYNAINREAQTLNVSANPIKVTRDFERTKARFHSLPPGRTMSEIEKGPPAGGNSNYPSGGDNYPQGGNNYPSGGNNYPNGNGYPENGGNGSQGQGSVEQYSISVPPPSTKLRAYTGVNWLRVSVPSNWIDHLEGQQVMFAPDGAFGDQGITRGAMFGVFAGADKDLQTASQEHLNGVLAVNSYLRQRGSLIETTLAGREAFTTTASGISPVTNRVEKVGIYTTQLRSGGIFYVITVVPEEEAAAYSSAFRSILSSIQINER